MCTERTVRGEQSERSKALLLGLLARTVCRVSMLCSTSLVSALTCSFSALNSLLDAVASVPPLHKLQHKATDLTQRRAQKGSGLRQLYICLSHD